MDCRIGYLTTRYGVDRFYVVWNDQNGNEQRSLSCPTLEQAEGLKKWYESVKSSDYPYNV